MQQQVTMHSGTLQLKTCSGNIAIFLQAFAAHNGEILSAAVVPSSNTMGSVVLTGGHDWQVHDSIMCSLLSVGVDVTALQQFCVSAQSLRCNICKGNCIAKSMSCLTSQEHSPCNPAASWQCRTHCIVVCC